MMALSKSFVSAAKTVLGKNGWSEAVDVRAAHATPWRGNMMGETPFVAYPATPQAVAALVRLCAEHKVAITPQGGNTGLVDGATPHGEITLSLKRMTDVRAVDPINNSLVVEAGAPLIAVQEAARGADRLFPLSLASEGTATIGGLISTNAGGVAVLRYGMMRDLVLGLEVVLPDGRIWEGLNLLRKNNTGYDLKHLFAGAEGTLGVITAASLKLFPRTQQATAWTCLPSAQAATELLAHIRARAGDTVTSFELIPARALQMVIEDLPDIRDPLPHPAPWRVLIELSMTDDAHARKTLESALMDAMNDQLVLDAVIAGNLQHAQNFWTIRESIPLSKRAYGTAINHDVSVPISAIPDFLNATAAAIGQLAPAVEIVAFGHVGDGNLHYSACEPAGANAPILAQIADDITDIVHAQVRAFGGSISAEHGVGRLKRDEIARQKAGPELDMMQAVKKALDPNNLMNPGRVLEMGTELDNSV